MSAIENFGSCGMSRDRVKTMLGLNICTSMWNKQAINRQITLKQNLVDHTRDSVV